MAGMPQQVLEVSADRRSLPRSDVNLGVRLHRVDAEAVIPASITNMSATGFLAEIAGDAALPDMLDVELPNAGRRKAEVVWANGRVVGCSFLTPLAKADLSAARLKSQFSEQNQPATGVSVEDIALDPTDRVWNVASETPHEEKWSLRSRMWLIGGLGALPWLSFAGIAAIIV